MSSSQLDTAKQTWVFIIGSTGEKAYEKDYDESIKKFMQDKDNELNLYVREYKYIEKQLSSAVADTLPPDPIYGTFGNAVTPEMIDSMDEAKETDEIKTLKHQRNALEYHIHNEILKNTTYGMFMPPIEMLDSVHVKLVNGAASGYQKSKYLKPKDAYDLLTAASEKKRIKECMQSLEKAEKLPKRIVLNGHSRGASACIELARAIYLKYGNEITIDMNISDPVPGQFRHKKSKMVIPPNVESLVITYAGRETNKIFEPQDFREIIYDDRKTTVTTMTLPVKHRKVYDSIEHIQSINHALWASFNESKDLNNDPLTKIKLPEDVNIDIKKGPRTKGQFIVATDPAINTNLQRSNSTRLQSFHNVLREKAGISLSLPNVFPKVSNNIQNNQKARKSMLKKLYRDEKKSRKQSTALQNFLTEIIRWQIRGRNIGQRALEGQELLDRTTNVITTFARKTKFHANIECIHANINTIVQISDPVSSQRVILLTGSRHNEGVIKKIGRPPYLAKEYYSSVNDNCCTSIIEFCPSSLLQQAKSSLADHEKIQAAIHAGSNISFILSDLTNKGVVWTDLKSNNLLLREDGSIAISDLKAFADPTRVFGEVSRQLAPKDMINEYGIFAFPTEAKEIQRVYNYQLANILYQQVTGKLVINQEIPDYKNKGNILEFDYTHPVFQTYPQGTHLRIVIHGLETNTLQHADAAKLLGNLYDPGEFKTILDLDQDKFKDLITKFPSQSIPAPQQNIKATEGTLQQPVNPVTAPISPQPIPQKTRSTLWQHPRIPRNDDRAQPRLTEKGKLKHEHNHQRFLNAISNLSTRCANLTTLNSENLTPKDAILLTKMASFLNKIKLRIAQPLDEKELRTIAHKYSDILKKIKINTDRIEAAFNTTTAQNHLDITSKTYHKV